MVDYQQIILIVADMLKIGVPIGIVFHIGEFIVGFLFKVMFPKHFGSDSL